MSNMKYTLESLLGQMKSATKVGKSINKNNIYRSRELCKDLMKLSRCKSMESIDAYLKEKDNEIVALEYFTQNWYVTTVKEINIAANLMADSMNGGTKYGAEAFRIYQASLEGANVPGKVGAFLDKIGKGFMAFWDKIVSFFVGLVRKATAFINGMFLKGYAKFEKEFDASKFQNVNAKIKAPKYPSNMIDKLKTSHESNDIVKGLILDINKVKNLDADALLKEDLDLVFHIGSKSVEGVKDQDVVNQVNKEFFDSEELPKSQEMTVAEFFGGASAGQRPKLLDALAESTVKTFKQDIENMKQTVKLMEAIKKTVGNMISKLKSKGEEAKDSIKNLQKLTKGLSNCASVLKTMTYHTFNLKVKVCGHIKHAASVGCGKVKEDKGKDKKEDKK